MSKSTILEAANCLQNMKCGLQPNPTGIQPTLESHHKELGGDHKATPTDKILPTDLQVNDSRMT